jgi:hypothetical protein
VTAVRLGKFANFLIKVKVIGFGGVTSMPGNGAALILMRKPDQSGTIR